MAVRAAMAAYASSVAWGGKVPGSHTRAERTARSNPKPTEAINGRRAAGFVISAVARTKPTNGSGTSPTAGPAPATTARNGSTRSGNASTSQRMPASTPRPRGLMPTDGVSPENPARHPQLAKHSPGTVRASRSHSGGSKTAGISLGRLTNHLAVVESVDLLGPIVWDGYLARLTSVPRPHQRNGVAVDPLTTSCGVRTTSFTSDRSRALSIMSRSTSVAIRPISTPL